LAVALWVVWTHALECFEIAPQLGIRSPLPRCGKTTLLKMLTRLVPRPLPASNLTAAVVFRVVESAVPTLLVDEADTFIAAREELIGVLNAGHDREMAFVVRTVGDQHEPRRFSAWCAKAAAQIGRFTPTQRDRSIEIVMRRRKRTEPVERLDLRRADVRDEFLHLHRQVSRWVLDHWLALADATVEPTIPDGLRDSDRAVDNWRPLLRTADLVGGEWASRARTAAVALSGGDDDEIDDTERVRLLRDIRGVFAADDRLRTVELLGRLTRVPDAPWATYRKGQPLDANALAGMLRDYEIQPRQWADGDSRPRGYLRAGFSEAWDRYLRPVVPLRSLPANEITALALEPGTLRSAGVTAAEIAASGRNNVQITGVTAPESPRRRTAVAGVQPRIRQAVE
jgi:putative DNA primase/helicase